MTISRRDFVRSARYPVSGLGVPNAGVAGGAEAMGPVGPGALRSALFRRGSAVPVVRSPRSNLAGRGISDPKAARGRPFACPAAVGSNKASAAKRPCINGESRSATSQNQVVRLELGAVNHIADLFLGRDEATLKKSART